MKLRMLLYTASLAVMLMLVITGCSDNNLPGDSSTTAASIALASGATTASTPISIGETTVTIPSGTTLTDSTGAPLSGSTAAITLTTANNTRFLPAAASQLPTNHTLAAYIDLTITNGAQQVATFSQPVTVVLDLTGLGVVPGDVVSLYSFDGTTWGTTATGTAVVDAASKATFSITHLSIWAALKPASTLFSSASFLTDLSNLTKSYIPPLFYTNLPAVNTTQAVASDAQKSLNRLITVWGDFKTKYKTKAEFTAYSAQFDEIDTKIAEAGAIIQTAISSGATANNLLTAHEALETIRHNLWVMDRANGFDYPIDVIKEFHDAMEPFALAVKGKTAATLTDTDVATLQSLFPIVDSTWNQVVTYQINKDHFGLSGDVKTFIDTATSNQTNNLKALKAALSAATPDKAVIAANGNNIKPLFLKLFFSFADFFTPFDSDLTAADTAATAAVTTTAKSAATADEVATAASSIVALENNFNKFKSHFATQPISIMGVLTWYTGSTTTPGYFDKITTAVTNAKTQVASVQQAGVYPADLTSVNTQLAIYATEMAKLKSRLMYQ